MLEDIEITPRADCDINDILRYISTTLCNPPAAQGLMRRFLQAFDTLMDFPEIGRIIADDSLGFTVRVWPCKNYLIYYKIDGTTLVIITVIYKKRDRSNLEF